MAEKPDPKANGRGEVAAALVSGDIGTDAYDCIGNHVCSASGAVTSIFAVNGFNQYVSVLSSPIRNVS